jgi:hypothetical protein
MLILALPRLMVQHLAGPFPIPGFLLTVQTPVQGLKMFCSHIPQACCGEIQYAQVLAGKGAGILTESTVSRESPRKNSSPLIFHNLPYRRIVSQLKEFSGFLHFTAGSLRLNVKGLPRGIRIASVRFRIHQSV